jgi:hypothetical protein
MTANIALHWTDLRMKEWHSLASTDGHLGQNSVSGELSSVPSKNNASVNFDGENITSPSWVRSVYAGWHKWKLM